MSHFEISEAIFTLNIALLFVYTLYGIVLPPYLIKKHDSDLPEERIAGS